MKGEEGFWREKGVWVERKEREIEIFDFAQNRVGPQRIYRKPSSIDRGGIELLSRTKTQ